MQERVLWSVFTLLESSVILSEGIGAVLQAMVSVCPLMVSCQQIAPAIPVLLFPEFLRCQADCKPWCSSLLQFRSGFSFRHPEFLFPASHIGPVRVCEARLRPFHPSRHVSDRCTAGWEEYLKQLPGGPIVRRKSVRHFSSMMATGSGIRASMSLSWKWKDDLWSFPKGMIPSGRIQPLPVLLFFIRKDVSALY